MDRMANNKPKGGAQRKRDYDNRQREQGRRPVQIWMTRIEESKVRAFLDEIKNKRAYELNGNTSERHQVEVPSMQKNLLRRKYSDS